MDTTEKNGETSASLTGIALPEINLRTQDDAMVDLKAAKTLKSNS
ncbi:MAG: hypothetical protein ABUK01_03420 [Leptospirales bacterium]